MINGILNVYKESGFTSHDVVAKLRGIVRQKKIGHTGTLDPNAVGVLPVCLGKATKACSFLEKDDKTYRAVLLLGVTTDTEDAQGKITGRSEVSVTPERIRDLIMSFLGDYQQIPPMYSAKKVGGKKLYDLAREGIVIERKPCLVHISRITIEKTDLPRVTFTVTCSKGTYIRSLCRDIGEKAGCGACMESLTRTRVGRFGIENACRLSEIESLVRSDRLSDILLPVDQVFADYQAATITQEGKKLLYNGNPLPLSFCRDKDTALTAPLKDLGKGDPVRVYDEEGCFIAVYKKAEGCLKPFKMFL